jgi:V-type H+-transporting ATPase subunit E
VSETGRFTEDILSAAKEKAQSIISQAESETQHALDEAKKDLAREAEDIVRNAQTEAEGVRRRYASESHHKLKLVEQQQKDKILSEVLEQAKRRVMEVAQDEKRYYPLLVSVIENGIREIGIDSVVIHVNANDIKRFDRTKLEREVTRKLDRPIKIEWSKELLDISGGAVVSSVDGRTRIVNTLEERFEAFEPKLLIEAGRLLFEQ